MIRVTAVTCLLSPAYLFCYLGNSIIKRTKGGEGGRVDRENEGESFLFRSIFLLCIHTQETTIQKGRIILGGG